MLGCADVLTATVQARISDGRATCASEREEEEEDIRMRNLALSEHLRGFSRLVPRRKILRMGKDLLQGHAYACSREHHIHSCTCMYVLYHMHTYMHNAHACIFISHACMYACMHVCVFYTFMLA